MSFMKKDEFVSGDHISVISAECYFQGTLSVQGALRVDGKLVGSVDNANHIVVGQGGLVEGDLTAKTIIISGTVKGDVCADNLDVLSSARVLGAIRSKNLLFEKGAKMKGDVTVDNDEDASKEEK